MSESEARNDWSLGSEEKGLAFGGRRLDAAINGVLSVHAFLKRRRRNLLATDVRLRPELWLTQRRRQRTELRVNAGACVNTNKKDREQFSQNPSRQADPATAGRGGGQTFQTQPCQCCHRSCLPRSGSFFNAWHSSTESFSFVFSGTRYPIMPPPPPAARRSQPSRSAGRHYHLLRA